MFEPKLGDVREMGLDISDANIFERFDKLERIGIIHHGPSTAVNLTDHGFPFELRICPSWAKKPLSVDDALPTEEDKPVPELFGPGSDIYKSHPDQVIGMINNTHVLALNIYPVFRPQYLLLAANSYRRQDEPMDLEDIEASWSFLRTVRLPHYVMYNCTKEAGCSRYHKHTQILRKPEKSGPYATDFEFFPDVQGKEIQVPYVYFLHRFENPTSVTGTALFDIYLDLLSKCRTVLGIAVNDKEALCPHNVLLVKEWIIVIPRRRGNFSGTGANSAGMLGMPTISNDALFKIWTDIGPANILSKLGVGATGKFADGVGNRSSAV